MNVVRVEGFEKALQLLTEIRDLLDAAAEQVAPVTMGQHFASTVYVPVLDVPMRDEKPARAADKPAGVSRVAATALGQRQALQTLLKALDGWIARTRENHTANGHRGEPVGGECWRSLHPEDVRTLVNDVSRAMGLGIFPHPYSPVEDRR